jgi:DNA-binding transcriptional LysR family regulator
MDRHDIHFWRFDHGLIRWRSQLCGRINKQLEAQLGMQLPERTTWHVRPALDDEAYYQRRRDFLADIEDLEASFSGAKPKGLLRVDVQGTSCWPILCAKGSIACA